MNRPSLIFAAAAAFALLWLSRSAHGQVRPPNIVLIVADDMGYADTGVYGSKDIPTPNIDALAAGGIRFTDAYVSGTICAPTRAGLLTGRYQQRFGFELNSGNVISGLPLDETTIADRLRAAGYRTALVGKWHLGSAPEFRPMQRGFDEFFGFLGGEHSYTNLTSESGPLYDGNKTVTDTSYLTDLLTDRAVDFIKRQKSHPFFLYLAFNAVHVPMQATDKYLARFPTIANNRRRTYAAMLSAMDDGIGRTLAALRAEHLEKTTLIIFFNDNGGPTVTDGINGSSNEPLRGSKGETWEGGIRVPFIVRWKGQLREARTDSRPIIQLDVLPTALAAAAIKVKPEWKLDGVNLLPFITGKISRPPHEILYWRMATWMAVRKGDWKLVKMTARWQLRNEINKEASPGDVSRLNDLSGAELYNLRDDIGETKNLAGAHPEKVEELGEAWRRWNKELPKPPPRRPGADVIGMP